MLLALLALVLAAFASAAGATPPGKDGRIYVGYQKPGKAAMIGSVRYDSVRSGGKDFKLLAKKARNPAPSPKGGTVAFDDGLGIYTVDSRGKQRRTVLYRRKKLACELPTFAPDGKRLAYVCREFESGDTRIWISNLRDGTRKALTPPEGRVAAFDFTPNGKRIVYTDSSSIKIVKTTRPSTPQQLTDSLPFEATIGAVTVSPDGETVAYSVYEGHDQHPDPQNLGIYKVDSDGSNPHRIYGNTDFLRRDPTVSFAPSGKRLAVGYVLRTIKPNGSGVSAWLLPAGVRVKAVKWDVAR